MTSRVSVTVLLLILIPIAAQGQQERAAAASSPAAEDRRESSFEWKPALLQSMLFLGVEHGFRLTQAKTRSELKGPFFADYFQSVRNIHGWSDGDSIFTSYVAHPMQGAVSGFIQIHNDPGGKGLEIGRLIEYAQKKIASVRQLHRTSLPIPHAGGTYPPRPLPHIFGGLLTFESDWNPPLGQPLTDALVAEPDSQLDLGCVAAHGMFSYGADGCFTIIPQGKPATAFLLELIARLQSSATVPMIDIRAYARWLAG